MGDGVETVYDSLRALDRLLEARERVEHFDLVLREPDLVVQVEHPQAERPRLLGREVPLLEELLAAVIPVVTVGVEIILHVPQEEGREGRGPAPAWRHVRSYRRELMFIGVH